MSGKRLWPTPAERWVAHRDQPLLQFQAERTENGLLLRITFSRPLDGGALQLTATGTEGRLLAQAHLTVPAGAQTITHQIHTPVPALRCKAVLLEGERVLESVRTDLI